MTRALFFSRNCLGELACALKASGVDHIIPVAFEDHLPRSAEQWTMVDAANDANGSRLRQEVQEGLGRLNHFPPRDTMLSSPHYVIDLVERVKALLEP